MLRKAVLTIDIVVGPPPGVEERPKLLEYVCVSILLQQPLRNRGRDVQHIICSIAELDQLDEALHCGMPAPMLVLFPGGRRCEGHGRQHIHGLAKPGRKLGWQYVQCLLYSQLSIVSLSVERFFVCILALVVVENSNLMCQAHREAGQHPA